MDCLIPKILIILFIPNLLNLLNLCHLCEAFLICVIPPFIRAICGNYLLSCYQSSILCPSVPLF